MARIARVIAAEIPHHITQRGNRRMPTFSRDADYAFAGSIGNQLIAKGEYGSCLRENSGS